MVWRPRSRRPGEQALGRADLDIVDAGDASVHESVRIELPVLVAVTAEPAATYVVPFVGKAHRNAIVAMRPDLLDEPVVELTLPLAMQEGHHCRASLEELVAIAPACIHGVRLRDPLRIA